MGSWSGGGVSSVSEWEGREWKKDGKLEALRHYFDEILIIVWTQKRRARVGREELGVAVSWYVFWVGGWEWELPQPLWRPSGGRGDTEISN